MRFKLIRLASLLFLGAGVQTRAQTNEAAPSPEMPVQTYAAPSHKFLPAVIHGLNGSISVAGVHDSILGWYNVVTGQMTYTFSPRYSADATLAIYPYRLASATTGTSSQTTELAPTHGNFSDTSLAFRTSFSPPKMRDTLTASMTLPSGNRPNGLGMGQVTFDFSNYAERYFRQATLLLETGVGDTSGLFNRLAPEDRNTLGPLAHFQTGLVVWATGRNYVQVVAYEQLPVGDQKTYSTLFGPGPMSRTIVSGRKVAEDNGLTTSVGIPLSSHIILTSSYNRSLRFKLDTVSTGLTFAFRGLPRKKKLSLIDKALLEAERLN